MPRFVLLDNFLTGLGGHNFQYACDVLQAARTQGYEPVAVVHQSCPTAAGWPAGWRLISAFHDAGEYRLGLGPDGRSRVPVDIDGQPLEIFPATGASARWQSWISPLFAWSRQRAQRERQRRLAQFAQDCHRVWQIIAPCTDDQFFFPSLSDFDLLGVVRFLRETPGTRDVSWHLQFHFDIFEGAEAEYERQPDQLHRFRQQFGHALQQIPEHEVYFYCTTEAVATQYNRLGVGEFHWLPYPVSDVFQPRERSPGRPLRVTCAGALRREKGKQALRPLYTALRDELQGARSLQLVVQGDPRQVRRWLPAGACTANASGTVAAAPVECVTHPLPADVYADFVCQADVGLFLYDARRYFSRCSGVLVEMMAAGVPVIAPAGCWLGQQVDGPNWEYLDSLHELNTPWPRERLHPSRLQLAAAASAGPAGSRSPRLIFDDVRVPAGATDACVRFSAADRAARGAFVELTVEQFGPGGKSLAPAWNWVLSPRRERAERSVLIRLHPQVKSLQLAFRDAYALQPFAIRHTEVTYLEPPTDQRHRPAGAVGLTAAHLGQVPSLLRELLLHYDHYRRNAADFAHRWREQHAAVRVVEQLVQRATAQNTPSRLVAANDGPTPRHR